MTAGELQEHTLEHVGESTTHPVFYTGAEVMAALNEAQRIMALLTLCLERTDTISIQPGVAFYLPRQTFPDWLLPLRVTLAGGARLRPTRLADLDALDSRWTSRAGFPDRYCRLGCNLLAINRQPAVASGLVVTFARTPTAMSGPDDVPEVPAEYHLSLADYAIRRLRMKEGGQEFAKTAPYGDKFLTDCRQLGDFMRARNLGMRYDALPFELSRYDVSAGKGLKK